MLWAGMQMMEGSRLEELMRCAATAESGSQHPLAAAVLHYAQSCLAHHLRLPVPDSAVSCLANW